MRAIDRTLFAALAVTTLLAGCDTPVTRPPEPPQAARPEEILLIGSCWCRTDLPFSPAAINDAGIVVGTNGSEAVYWQNGILDTLQHSVALSGPYRAVAISPNGAILGAANGHTIYWQTPTSPPNDVNSGFPYLVEPMAINDAHTIVGWSWKGYGLTAWRYTPTTGWVEIGAGLGISGFDQTIPTSLNANGQAAGYRYLYNSGTYLPVRWNATGGPIALPAPLDWSGMPSGRANSIDGAGNIYGFTSAGATIWNYYGGSTLVTGMPAIPSLRSNSGRFVGVGYNSSVQQPFTSFNGALTWLASPDLTAPTPVGVNACGTIVARRATSPATGFLWKRSGIAMYQCDIPPVVTTTF